MIDGSMAQLKTNMPRIRFANGPLTGGLLDIDAREAVLLLGALCLLPIRLFSFIGIFDVYLMVVAFLITPCIVLSSMNFIFTREHAVMALLALWTGIAFAQNPTNVGCFIGWSMYVMPCILLFALPQLEYRNEKKPLERGIGFFAPLLAVQLLIIVFFLFLKHGDHFNLHFGANIYWAKSNYIAAMLELPLIWFFDRLHHKTPNRKMTALWFGMCLGALLLTVSRGGIITFVFSVILYNVLVGKKIPKLLIGLLGLLLVFAVMSKMGTNRMFHLLDRGNIDRLYLWAQSIKLIIKQPLFGYGPGNVNLQADIINRAAKMPGPHNLILEVMLHIGIGGFFIFAILLGMLIKKAYVFYKVKKEPVFFVLIVASLMHSMVEPTFLGASYSFLFWYFMSILLVRYKEEIIDVGVY
jgi:O-antigen ligase